MYIFPKSRVSRNILIGILFILMLYALLFILFQQSREKKYKVEILNTQLQDFNNQLNESLENGGEITKEWLDSFLLSHHKENLRLTVVMEDGKVVYDNLCDDVTKLMTHRFRKEVAAALVSGSGYDINRTSLTLGEEYFYSATYFPDEGYVIRTALPYNVSLVEDLEADNLYFWFAIVLMLIFVGTVWRFCYHIDKHIVCLRTFATKAENGEPLDTPDLMSFNHDELGEVAWRIIIMYRKLKETRQEQDKLKRQLTQNIAHELKTPVASIQGYLDTILTQPDMDKKTKRKFLEKSFAQVTRLTALIRDILILNRLDEVPNGGIDGTEEVVDVKQVFSQVVADTEQGIKRQEMTWDITLPNENVCVKGTEKRVYSIFRNLTDNAIAYAGKGTTITMAIAKEADTWHIKFADNGVGVAASHLPRLFERFYRVDKGRSRENGGTGLGLSIVKNSVLSMHGVITVAKGREGGLVFDIVLPVC